MKSKLLKVLAVTLAVALSSVAAFAATVPADVQGTDCEKAVTKLVEENIITGDTDGLYHPDKNLTRAEVSTLIAKAVDPKAADSKAAANYSDMAGYGWAAPFIGMMTEKQIAKGYPDGTFKPGANVKVSELAAFVIRACGINDGDLEGTWPDNYMKKADEMDLFDVVEGKDQTSMLDPNVPATKEQAAIAVYNALDQIRGDEPMSSDWTFANIACGDLSKIDGIPVAADLKVYPYGKAKDYKADMTLPDVKKIEAQNPVKYTNVTTNGFYKVEGGKVTAMILPADQGFSGRVYGVVTGYFWTVNANGEQVLGIETLAAGQEIEWTCQTGIKEADITAMIETNDPDNNKPTGDFVEIQTTKGQVKSLTTDHTGAKYLVELSLYDPTGTTTTSPKWNRVLDRVKDKGLIKMNDKDGLMYIAYADNAVVYVWDEESAAYEVGSIDSINKYKVIRAYDITDDKEDEANIIFVKDAPEDDHN